MGAPSFQGWELLALSLGSLVAGWATRAILAVLTALKRLALQERVYSDDTCKKGMLAVMERVRSTHLFSERREVVGTRMQPAGLVIGTTFVAHVTRVAANERSFYDRGTVMRVSVVRWRWMPPLVSDDAITDNANQCLPGVIHVMRKSGDKRAGWIRPRWRSYRLLNWAHGKTRLPQTPGSAVWRQPMPAPWPSVFPTAWRSFRAIG